MLSLSSCLVLIFSLASKQRDSVIIRFLIVMNRRGAISTASLNLEIVENLNRLQGPDQFDKEAWHRCVEEGYNTQLQSMVAAHPDFVDTRIRHEALVRPTKSNVRNQLINLRKSNSLFFFHTNGILFCACYVYRGCGTFQKTHAVCAICPLLVLP